MANNQQGTGDDILLNVSVTGREELTGARNDAKGLRDELKDAGKTDLTTAPKSLKQQLREATLETQRLYAAGKQNTEEYRNSAKRVAEIKDSIQELNKTFEAFDPDNKFKVFANTAASGAKIVQGYAGAMAFLGVNSKDAQETIAKLQGIMAFTDAISSLADLKDNYKDLLLVLGLNKAKTQEVVQANEVAAASAETTSQAEVSAADRVATARAALAETSIAADTALVQVREQGLNATVEMTAAEESYLTAAAARAAAVEELTAAEAALAASEQQATAATIEQATAQEGVAVAEEGSTVAAIGLGTALKAIGIGLIISAIAYLISNFDKVKKTVTDLFPGLSKATDLFNKVKEVAYGVGNVILQYIIAPIKVLIDLLKGDFKGALEDLKKGFDVVGNFKAGVAAADASIAEAARKVRVQKEIEANELIIKERKALGKNTTKLEVDNNKLRISLLEKDDEDYAKKKRELESDNTVILNAEWKRQNDIYKAKLKTDLDAIKANNLAAKNIVEEGTKNQRDTELTDIDIRYKAEFAVLEKRKAQNKKYNEDYTNLVTARKIEEQRVNKKYDDAIKAYNDEASQTYFTQFEKREAEIKKKAEDLLKNATPQQAAQIKQNEAFLLTRNNDESIATSSNSKAQTDLTNAENSDRPLATDTPDEARTKVDKLEAAKLAAEDAAYNLKKVQLQGQYDELAQLDADHEKKKTDIEQDGSESRKAIAEAEKEARLKMFDAIGQGADAASQLVGENTLAGKALAVAAATINTYASIAGTLAAFSSVPIPGYAIAQAIATGVFGLLQVKKILSVKVPAKSGGASATGQAAPQINSTVLNQANAGSQNVVDAVNGQAQKDKPLRAYIVNKDLNDQKAQDDYYNQQSTY